MSDTPGQQAGVLAVRVLPARTVLFDVEDVPRLLTYEEALAHLYRPRTGYENPFEERLVRDRLDGNADYAVDVLASLGRTSYDVIPPATERP